MSNNQNIECESHMPLRNNNIPDKNCVSFKKKIPKQIKTSLKDDKCTIMDNSEQSIAPGNYMLSNFNICDCKIDDVIDIATENPNLVFRDGYGVSDCVIDESNKIRVGKVRKYPKCTQQLFERPYLTVPYMGRGSGNSNIETKLLPGEDTSQKRPCNSLAGVSIDNQFIPLVKNLKDNVQDPQNIIQEVADDKWIRGGIPSRQFVKDIDYIERCQDKYKNKQFIKKRMNYN